VIAKRRLSESCRPFLCFVFSTVRAENAVSQRYVLEKQRRHLIVISCKFGYSFFILVQNFELLIELLRMPFSGMWRCVCLLYGDVSEERVAFIFRVYEKRELGKVLDGANS
jgi:hypothetical protein